MGKVIRAQVDINTLAINGILSSLLALIDGIQSTLLEKLCCLIRFELADDLVRLLADPWLGWSECMSDKGLLTPTPRRGQERRNGHPLQFPSPNCQKH